MTIKMYQVDPEYQDTDYLESDDYYSDIIVTGNRDYVDLNKTDVFDNIIEYCIETDHLLWSIEDHDYQNATEAIKDLLGVPVNKYQVHRIKELLAGENISQTESERDGLTCALLSVLTRKHYLHATIRGFCQGDWQDIFYPADEYTRDDIRDFESLYFNTGCEFAITEGDDEDDTFYDYFTDRFTWPIESLKQEAAARYGVKPEDVTVYEFDGYNRTPRYKEAA